MVAKYKFLTLFNFFCVCKVTIFTSIVKIVTEKPFSREGNIAKCITGHLHNILSKSFHTSRQQFWFSAYALNVLQMCLVETLTFNALLTIISLHLSDFIMMFNRNNAPSVFEKYVTTVSYGGKDIQLNLYERQVIVYRRQTHLRYQTPVLYSDTLHW